MKYKFGFNLVFALIAFPIGLALLREFDFSTLTFRKTALGSFYLIVFVVLLFLTFKENKNPNKQE